MTEPWAALILVSGSIGLGILHSLLGVERPVWATARGGPGEHPVQEADLRVVHRSLRGLAGYLPAGNSIIILGTLVRLIWQGAATS